MPYIIDVNFAKILGTPSECLIKNVIIFEVTVYGGISYMCLIVSKNDLAPWKM